jgi:hypothetical protein
MSIRGSLILYVFSIVTFIFLANIPMTGDISNVPGIGGIVLLAPWIAKSVFWVSIILAVVLLILAILSFVYETIRFPVIALLLSIAGFPYAAIQNVVSSLASWTLHSRIQTEDKETYIFCNISFLQGQTMAISRLEREGPLFTNLTVLGTNNGDSPRSWASIIRPAGAIDEYGQLYLTDRQVLVGIRYENRCYLTYDIEQRKFLGHGDIESLSPFVCLNANTKIHEPDVQRIREQMRTTAPGLPGFPHRDTLQAGLQHPNPRVREIAKGLLELSDAHSASTGSAQESQ